MANDTKERILVAALEMFSQNGYGDREPDKIMAFSSPLEKSWRFTSRVGLGW